MRNIKVFILPFFLLVILIVSCNKTESPVSPVTIGKGSLIGKVHPRTEQTDLNSTDTLDYSNFVVSIDGTTHTTMTDVSGNWFFGNLPLGSYSISFSKNGYSSYKQTNAVVIVDDTADFPIYMYKLTSARITNLIYNLSAAQLKLNYRLTVSLQRDYYVRFLFSNDSNVGNPLQNYLYSEADLLFHVPNNAIDTSYTIEIVNLYSHGMASGSRIYFYGNVGFKNQYYLDSLSGRRVYSSYSSSPTEKLSLVLP